MCNSKQASPDSTTFLRLRGNSIQILNCSVSYKLSLIVPNWSTKSTGWVLVYNDLTRLHEQTTEHELTHPKCFKYVKRGLRRKHLTYKHKHLSSDPQHPHRKLDVGHTSVIPGQGSRSWGLLANQARWTSEKPCLKNKVESNKWRYPTLIYDFHTHACTHTHTQNEILHNEVVWFPNNVTHRNKDWEKYLWYTDILSF